MFTGTSDVKRKNRRLGAMLRGRLGAATPPGEPGGGASALGACVPCSRSAVIVTMPLSGPPALSVRNGPRELVIHGSSGRWVISGNVNGSYDARE